MEFAEQYQDVLQNIEFGITSVYRQHPEMVDHTAMRALEALIDHYVARQIGRTPRRFSLDSLETETFERRNPYATGAWAWRRDREIGPQSIHCPPTKSSSA